MRVLFDVVDTGHVQFFRPIIKRLQAEGHQVKITARDKDITLYLLDKFNIPHQSISRMGRGLVGLAAELISRDVKLFRIASEFRPDVMVAQTGVSVGVIGVLLGIPTIVLEEAEHAKLQRMISLPFVSRIMTGTGYLHDHGKKQRRFRGIWVQSYLTPSFFVPSTEPLVKAGLNPEEPYIVLRTVSWEAAHDVGHKGVSEKTLREAIECLKPYGRVLVSAEKPLPELLREYANPVPAEHIHHLLAFAKLYIGEGGTMAAEAAVMGVPAIFCNPLRCGYLLALEKDYDLLYNVQTLAQGLPIAERLLQTDDLKEKWAQKRDRLWSETDDIVDFTINLLNQTADHNAVSVDPENKNTLREKTSAAPQNPLKSSRAIWKKLLYAFLAIVILVFVGRSLWQGFTQLNWSELDPNYFWIGVAAMCLMIHRFLTGATFSLLLSSFGEKIGLIRAVAIEWVTGLGQYVPGKIVAISGIVTLLVESKVHVSVAMALSVLPVALTVLLGFLYSAPLFVMDPLRHYMNWGAVFMICVILLCGIGLVPSIFLRNTNFMLRLMRRPQIQSSAESGKLVFASGLIILRFIFLGLGFFLLAKGFTDVSWKHLFFFSMVSVASSVAGFLAFFTPAGLGVREGVILLLLGSTLGSSDIAIIAVSLRLIQVLVDLTVGGIGISFLRKIGLRTKNTEIN